MSIHAEAAQVEYRMFHPGGRTTDDGTWFGSGKHAEDLFPTEQVGREGKTRRDRQSGSWGNRFANRSSREGVSTGSKVGKKAR